MPEGATVHVVDDEQDVRDSLRWLLSSEGLSVETYESGAAFLEGYRPRHPECLILDLRMPGMSGLELQRELNARGMDIPTILLTGQGDVESAVDAMKAGAIDFLQKPFDDEALLERIRQAVHESALAHRRQLRHAETQAQLESLTPREQEVLGLLMKGNTSKQIASALGVSTRTAEVHRAHVMKKMQAGSLAELVARIVRYQDTLD